MLRAVLWIVYGLVLEALYIWKVAFTSAGSKVFSMVVKKTPCLLNEGDTESLNALSGRPFRKYLNALAGSRRKKPNKMNLLKKNFQWQTRQEVREF
jgi:hypothetical protein